MGDGRLLVIGTPIGNLGDLSPRAQEALRACDVLLCEDTRHTRKLLTHFGISAKLESFHDHNEDARSERIIERIRDGEVVGLVSDAGMPLVSDPGFALVRRARAAGIRIEPIPGPFAGVLALVASGLAPLPFSFHGFAPRRENERLDFYRAISRGGMTAIVYESPERVIDSLQTAVQVLGNVEVTLGREMTKMHEEFLHGGLSEVIATLSAREAIKGEITIIFAAGDEIRAPQIDHDAILAEFQRLRTSGMRRPDAARLLGEKYGLRKSEVYKLLLE